MFNFNPTDNIKEIIRKEGGYVNDPTDAGGETKFGISKRAYPSVNIKKLTEESAIKIYMDDYVSYIPTNICGKVKYCVFDFGINSGRSRAIKTLQSICGASQDGHWGPNSQKKYDTLDISDDKKALLYLSSQQDFYRIICEYTPSNYKYLKGWIARAEDTKKFIELIK